MLDQKKSKEKKISCQGESNLDCQIRSQVWLPLDNRITYDFGQKLLKVNILKIWHKTKISPW